MSTVSLSSPCALLLSRSVNSRIGKPSVSLRSPFHAAGNVHLTLSSRSSSFSYNPLSFAVGNKGVEVKKNRRGAGAVCYAGAMTTRSIQWVSAISSAVLMLAKGTSVQKSFLVPLLVLQAPASIISWMKGQYGIWAAFLALIVRLFLHIPGELELPFMALLLAIVAPHEVMSLRGTQEGAIVSILIAAYLAFQHFSKTGLEGSFDMGSVVATVAIFGIAVASVLLLI